MSRLPHLTAEQLAANVSGVALDPTAAMHLARCKRCQRAWSRLEALQSRVRGSRAVELLPEALPGGRPGFRLGQRTVRWVGRSLLVGGLVGLGWMGGRAAPSSDISATVRDEAARPAPTTLPAPRAAARPPVDDRVRWVAGAEVLAVDAAVAEGVPGLEPGLLVLRVAAGYPMNRVGLVPGDLIVAADGRPTPGATALRKALASEQELELEWVRGGQRMTGPVRP